MQVFALGFHDLAPDYLSEIFTKNSACSRKNLRNTATDLQVPLMKTCNGQRAFSYRGARVWNHLDLELKQASSFKAFKYAVKNDFFRVSFYHLFIYLFTLSIILIRIGFLNDEIFFLDFKHGPLKSSLRLTG